MTFDWFCIGFGISVLGIELLSLKWIQWVGLTGGTGEGIFVLLAIIAAVRWQMLFSPEQTKATKLSFFIGVSGIFFNIYIILIAARLLPMG